MRARRSGLSVGVTLPADLPPRPALPVLDDLTGHKTPELVPRLCAHGVMPLDTPLGGAWEGAGSSSAVPAPSRRTTSEKSAAADGRRSNRSR